MCRPQPLSQVLDQHDSDESLATPCAQVHDDVLPLGLLQQLHLVGAVGQGAGQRQTTKSVFVRLPSTKPGRSKLDGLSLLVTDSTPAYRTPLQNAPLCRLTSIYCFKFETSTLHSGFNVMDFRYSALFLLVSFAGCLWPI